MKCLKAVMVLSIYDGSSPKKTSPGRALKVDFKPGPSLGPSEKVKPEPSRASNFYCIQAPIFCGLFKKSSLSLDRALSLLTMSSPSPPKKCESFFEPSLGSDSSLHSLKYDDEHEIQLMKMLIKHILHNFPSNSYMKRYSFVYKLFINSSSINYMHLIKESFAANPFQKPTL